MRALVLSLGLMACGGPEPGPAGRAGADGPGGLPGEVGPTGDAGLPASVAFRWVDAAGAVVTPDEHRVHIDDDGYVWVIEAETGQVELRTPSRLYYPSDDCTGVPWAAGFSPREPFRSGLDDAWYVRPDDLVAEDMCALSEWDRFFESCDTVTVPCPIAAFPLDACERHTDPTFAPVLPWVGPLTRVQP